MKKPLKKAQNGLVQDLIRQSLSSIAPVSSTSTNNAAALARKKEVEQEQNDIKIYGSVERANQARAIANQRRNQPAETLKKIPNSNISGKNQFTNAENVENAKTTAKAAMVAVPAAIGAAYLAPVGTAAAIDAGATGLWNVGLEGASLFGRGLRWSPVKTGPGRFLTPGNLAQAYFFNKGIEDMPAWWNSVKNFYEKPSWDTGKSALGYTGSQILNFHPGYHIAKEAKPLLAGEQSLSHFLKDIFSINKTEEEVLAGIAAARGAKFATEYGTHSFLHGLGEGDGPRHDLSNLWNNYTENYNKGTSSTFQPESTGISKNIFKLNNDNFQLNTDNKKYGGDQYGGEYDIDAAYEIMKRGGYAKDARKKNGGDWDKDTFQNYMMKKGGLPKASQGNLGMYPQNNPMFSDLYTSSDRENMLMNLFRSGQIPLSSLPAKLQVQDTMQQDLFNGMLAGAPGADGVYRNYQVKDSLPRADVGKGMYADPNKTSPWTYDYTGGKWYGYNKGKKYDISGYQSSVDILNKAYPNVVNPNNTGTNTNTAAPNTNTANPNTTTTTTDNKTETATTTPGTTNQGTTSQVAPANPYSGLDNHIYLNMIASQSRNKAGLLPAMAAAVNLTDALKDSAQGYGLAYKGIKSLFPKKPVAPNLSIQEQNENKQAKANLQQSFDEYKNPYLREEPTPEVDPLADGDFLSGLETGYPTQGFQEPADIKELWSRRDYLPLASKQVSQLSTNQYNDEPMRSPNVPLTPPLMRQEDYSPYEQWNQQIADPNSMYYNPYIKRRGGNIYLPKAVWGEELIGSPNPGTQAQPMTGLTSLSGNTWNTQTPAAVQNSIGYQAVQDANQNATKIADPNNSKVAPDGKYYDKETGKELKAPKDKKGPPVFNTAQAAKNVSELAFTKNFLGAFNDAKTQIDDSWNSNTSERINPQQGMMDYGNYTTNTTQGTNFRPNQMQYTQSPNKGLLDQNLMNLADGGSIWDKYEDGAEVDINDLSYDDILKIYASGGTIDYI